MKKTVIISGASGYIGKNFIRLYNKDFNIIAVVRNKDKLKEFESNIRILAFEEFLNNQDIKADYLLNLAFPRKSDIDLILDSYDFTYDLLDKSYEYGVKTIINISSQSVYDKNRIKEAKETDLLKPFSLYGIAKIYTEKYFEDFANKYNIDYLNLRIASIIGENFDQRFINKFIYHYLNDEDMNLIDSGKKFSFLHVEDACEVFAEIIKADKLKVNEVYNIGAEDEYTIEDIIDSIRKVINYKSKSRITIDKATNIDNSTNKVSIKKIKEELNWYPKINLDTSIEKIWRSYEA
ncbi:NAD(P)-dependent oxidoreductase [uncultured Helcococcus sp.]|uniref:NAD-dependent epimerase/dehydratase family protein n=1 Tax=uncultured Helcococcus sp. TaxID=1072508 RepID=UPI00262DAB78|nr:NAD-dependent epimerase/dehydratase family protein [uncultured Helcococcus sp.]